MENPTTQATLDTQDTKQTQTKSNPNTYKNCGK